VHFLPADPPALVARKLLRVNLSDLAAMGAVPLGYLLTLAVPPGTDDAWFAAFASGLAQDQAAFALALLGGDTVSTPGPLAVTATLIGHVAPGTALRRRGGAPGHGLWVTGTIGDGALGLRALRGELPDPRGTLGDRYHLPQPRLGLALHGIVSACMDVSDGLVQDVGHLARQAGCGAVIDAARVPRSDAARALGETWLETCLTGGDDYELLMAVPEENAARLLAAAGTLPVTRIGRLTPGAGVDVLDAAGARLTLSSGGWSHL
jgi:thiamine-monophosphate kinase